MNRSLFGAVCVFIGSAQVLASDPTWWTAPTTRIIDPSGTLNNYGPLNLGQAKHVAQQAKEYLDEILAPIGGAGPQIVSMVNGLQSDAATNHAPINLGQLKAVSSLFFDRLSQIGYGTKQNLIARGYPSTWPWDVPWNPNTPASENYVPANIGQLKMVFSFDLANFDFSQSDADDDGLNDVWEVGVGLSPFIMDGADSPTGDKDSDSVPNSEDARPNDATKGRLTVTISSPVDLSAIP